MSSKSSSLLLCFSFLFLLAFPASGRDFPSSPFHPNEDPNTHPKRNPWVIPGICIAAAILAAIIIGGIVWWWRRNLQEITAGDMARYAWKGAKVEIKHMNSFSAMHRAIDFEIYRQVQLHSQGQGDQIVQETRLWEREEGAQGLVYGILVLRDLKPSKPALASTPTTVPAGPAAPTSMLREEDSEV